MTRAGVRANSFEDLNAINFRQLQIQQHKFRQRSQIRAGWEEIVERLSTITRDDDFVEDLVLFQCAKRECLVIGVVFHQKNGFVLHGLGSIPGRDAKRCGAALSVWPTQDLCRDNRPWHHIG